jgi:hypothetical protein
MVLASDGSISVKVAQPARYNNMASINGVWVLFIKRGPKYDY